MQANPCLSLEYAAYLLSTLKCIYTARIVAIDSSYSLSLKKNSTIFDKMFWFYVVFSQVKMMLVLLLLT